ncbi:MAG: hypothetical protein NT098_00935 [Candidatus Parcubacteria bacterium]|nr:hypothetical protein [Candidatus Parcubacteria bacterium]
MKHEKVITWMHLPKKAEISEKVANLPQSEKWWQAMCYAPLWKKDEYAAQAVVWEEFEEWMFDGVNPLTRA